MDEIIYPVERLLANPRVFFAIWNALGGPDVEMLKSAFYELIENGFSEVENPDDIQFDAEEVSFSIDPISGDFQITLSNGFASILKPLEGETRAFITNDSEMAATTAIYDRIVKSIVEANPAFANNIALCSPPTPGNSYLRSEDGERFEGEFHLLSDPGSQYAFAIDIVDVNADILKATYTPIR